MGVQGPGGNEYNIVHSVGPLEVVQYDQGTHLIYRGSCNLLNP